MMYFCVYDEHAMTHTLEKSVFSSIAACPVWPRSALGSPVSPLGLTAVVKAIFRICARVK